MRLEGWAHHNMYTLLRNSTTQPCYPSYHQLSHLTYGGVTAMDVIWPRQRSDCHNSKAPHHKGVMEQDKRTGKKSDDHKKVTLKAFKISFQPTQIAAFPAIRIERKSCKFNLLEYNKIKLKIGGAAVAEWSRVLHHGTGALRFESCLLYSFGFQTLKSNCELEN